MLVNVGWVSPSIVPPLAGLLVLLLALPTSAHIPTLRGRLIDLIRRSDVIVLGTAERVKPVGARRVDTDLAVHDVLAGTPPGDTLTFRGSNGIAAGERYVVFLHRTATGFESIQGSGTVFPSRPADDEDYRRAIRSISQALHNGGPQQIATVRTALIAALSAAAAPLRYHAALELSALAHDGHQPTDAERQQLAAMLASPTLDPGLRSLLRALVSPPQRNGE